MMYYRTLRLGLSIFGQEYSDYSMQDESGGKYILRLTEHGAEKLRVAKADAEAKGAALVVELALGADAFLDGIEIEREAAAKAKRLAGKAVGA